MMNFLDVPGSSFSSIKALLAVGTCMDAPHLFAGPSLVYAAVVKLYPVISAISVAKAMFLSA